MRRAVLLSAIFEAATGIALIATPSLVGLLLLGTELSGAAVVVARVAGLALLALAVACWPRRMLPRQQRVALLGYNLLVALYLTYVGLQTRTPPEQMVPTATEPSAWRHFSVQGDTLRVWQVGPEELVTARDTDTFTPTYNAQREGRLSARCIVDGVRSGWIVFDLVAP